MADPPSAGNMDVDRPGSVRDVSDLEDMELTDSLIGHMVDDSLLRLLRGPDLLLELRLSLMRGWILCCHLEVRRSDVLCLLGPFPNSGEVLET